jgi:hypothetical protein
MGRADIKSRARAGSREAKSSDPAASVTRDAAFPAEEITEVRPDAKDVVVRNAYACNDSPLSCNVDDELLVGT